MLKQRGAHEEATTPAPGHAGSGSTPGAGPRRLERSDSIGEAARRAGLPATIRGPQPNVHKAPYTLCLATRLTDRQLSQALPGYLRRKVAIDPYPNSSGCDYPRFVHEGWGIEPEDVAEIERLLLNGEGS